MGGEGRPAGARRAQLAGKGLSGFAGSFVGRLIVSDRSGFRPGLLVSMVVHLAALWALVLLPPPPMSRESRQRWEPTPVVAERVFLPPPELLRPEAAPPVVPRPPDRPARLPAARPAKERISIGPPSDRQAKGPLVLRREDDLTAVPKGDPAAAPVASEAQPEARGQPGPAGAPDAFAGGDAPRVAPSAAPSGEALPAPRSIASALRRWEQGSGSAGSRGIPSGTGSQLGPLFFDPEGADFTAWINRFKSEVYRNWLTPQSALLGFSGDVAIEFVVERDGTLGGLAIVSSSGTTSLDRSARNALLASRFLPLPSDYTPPRVSMVAVFRYGDGRR